MRSSVEWGKSRVCVCRVGPTSFRVQIFTFTDTCLDARSAFPRRGEGVRKTVENVCPLVQSLCAVYANSILVCYFKLSSPELGVLFNKWWRSIRRWKRAGGTRLRLRGDTFVRLGIKYLPLVKTNPNVVRYISEVSEKIPADHKRSIPLYTLDEYLQSRLTILL